MKKKSVTSLALLLAGAVSASAILGDGILSEAAEDDGGWISDEDLEANSTEEPEPDEVLPNANQYKYQKDELAAFCHFGPNTFNEVEWGESYGDKSPDEIFKVEEDIAAETYVKALKDAGFKKLIVTAKHHDGFCIWASDYTDYDVAETSYKDGEGDILKEISAACTEYDMDMGLYLSPWDIHDDSYGYYDENGNATTEDNDYLDYNEYYNNQLKEILGNDDYGNDGHFVEVWMDGAKGSGSDAQEYDFELWYDTIQSYEGEAAGYEADCMLFGAGAYTTVRWIGNENGYADKNTWSKSIVDYETNSIDSNDTGSYTVGYEDGNQWTVPEADARITSGWFWGTTKNTPKSISDLASMYFGSIGNNATLLLNVPPNDEGTVDQEILDRVAEFGQNIEETFDDNLAADEGASVKADNVRGSDTAFQPGNTVDGDDSTYWTTDDGTNTGTLLIDLGGTKTFDVVSIEEAIQNGQRINEYKVEYRNEDGEWEELDSGETIGAKRLVRSSAVKGDQVRITVSTSEGKVPMISEIGVYKASEGFELTSAAPDGMDVIDITDDSFSFEGSWTDETGSNFIGGTNKWANSGSGFTLEFEGTKVYLMGTIDPNHGTADVYIDGEYAGTIDTYASSRALGQTIFESEDLEDGTHTLTLEIQTDAIGVEAAYVINNGGKGMVGLEYDEYTMNEDSTMEVKLVRVGGSTGEVTVQAAPNPGTAIQDDFNTELITDVTFEDGQTEATAVVETRRNTNQTGDRQFTLELTSMTDDLIVGFNDKAAITILDTESSTREALEELVQEGNEAKSEWYLSGWDEYSAAVAEGSAVLDNTSASVEEISAAISAITEAKENLVKREQYTEDDPFEFPWRDGSSSTLEAEFSILNDVELASDNGYALSIGEADWASNGQFVNALNQQDTISIPYYAEKAGTYTVTAYYRSGSATNELSWSEEDGKIVSGSVSAGASDSASSTHEVTFTIEITEAGAGTLIFTGPDGKSPQLDRLEISPAEISLEEYTITASAGEHGTISDAGETVITEGGSKTYTITPDEGYEIADVLVNGESVGAVDSYTFENISGDASIEAVFSFRNYTEASPFYFPTEADGSTVTLEAENLILNNTGSGETWPLQIGSADWASNGEYVNAMNSGDSVILYYYAEKAGTYEVTLQYRSGDTNNSFTWSEADGSITKGALESVEAESSADTTHTVVLTWEVVTPGAGVLTLTAGSSNAPQLDKFDIGLIEESGSAETDKTDLADVIARAEAELQKTGTYTEESLAALETALESAKSVYEDTDASQSDTDTQTAALTEALENLETIPETETYTVTASAGVGGTIDPSGEFEINAGESVTFTITADEGYKVSDVAVNGTSVGPVTEYTLADVSEDTTVEALFEKEEADSGSGEGEDSQNPDGDDQQDSGGASDGDDTQNGGGNQQTVTDTNTNAAAEDSGAAGSNISTAAETGDSGNTMIWISLLAASCAAACIAGAAIVIIRKKHRKAD